MKKPIETVISPDIHQEIMQRLAGVEKEHRVKVLFAIESGSRAWGFSSKNSDYDVRFIYIHPPEWYLTIDKKQRDVIEYPIVDDIDLNGWDINKALGLFWKSNPAFIEWIQSPLIYRDDGFFAQNVRDLIPQIYDVNRGIYHYRSMAKNNYYTDLRDEFISLKKYFYTLRALLSVRWIEQYQCAAPIEFESLLILTSDQTELHNDIQKLLQKKREGLEMGKGARIPSIQTFIESEMLRLQDFTPESSELPPTALPHLNQLFLMCLKYHFKLQIQSQI